MSTSYSKVKTPPKQITVAKAGLNALVLETMATISEVVGSTLGPGGKVVIIERQEVGMPNIVTKDGVTVFKSLGFANPTKHAIMEVARDAASKTAHDAGDGTSNCSVLSEAIVRNVQTFTTNNPDHVSPQKAIRTIENLFKSIIEPSVTKLAFAAGKGTLHSIAKVSANGDSDLADAVVECFNLVGDDGNVTISEISGGSEYKVEKIEGFPIPRGYEDTMGKFYNEFINDKANQRVFIEKPCFVLYHGSINDLQTLVGISNILGQSWQTKNHTPNVVIVATGFSENVIGNLAYNFQQNGLKILPVIAPLSPMPNGQLDFLEDLSSVTGAIVFNPINNPLPGNLTEIECHEYDVDTFGGGIQAFEMYRNKSTIIGKLDDELILERVDILKIQAKSATSILDKSIIEERIGKITGGIARLIVSGSSSGEIREKKDRAEDAVRAVQGALVKGCLPAGGWTLAKLISILDNHKGAKIEEDVIKSVLIPSFQDPIKKLYENIGLNAEEVQTTLTALIDKANSAKSAKDAVIYDCLNLEWVNAKQSGLLDSTPAVLEAIRNSLSIASLLGMLGGVIVFFRDSTLEREEAHAAMAFDRASNTALD